MKKKNKLILAIICCILLIFTIIIILIKTKIITNPFLDTKDLVCERTDITKEYRIVSFNKKGNVRKIVEKYVFSYESDDLAKKAYDEMKMKQPSKNIQLNDNNVILEYTQTELNNFWGEKMGKKEIKKYYEEMNNYNCE